MVLNLLEVFFFGFDDVVIWAVFVCSVCGGFGYCVVAFCVRGTLFIRGEKTCSFVYRSMYLLIMWLRSFRRT